MLRIRVNTAEAEIIETELITAGRKGLKCQFTFSEDWADLAKTVVVIGTVQRDILLVGDTIEVPSECIRMAQFPLKIGVYGAKPDGTIVIPTIWANFGKVFPGAKPVGISPDLVTPDLVAQIVQAAQNALYLAQLLTDRANSGEFNGKDGATGPRGPQGVQGPQGNPFTYADFTPEQLAALTGPAGEDGADGANGVGVPSGGTTGQVLKKASGTDYDTEWADESGGGGTSDYSDLTNKPSINSVTLSGNKSLSDLGAEPEALVVTVSYSDTQLRYVADATYSEISSAITAKKRIKVFRSNANKYYDLFAVKSSSIEFASVGDGENELLSVNSSNLWTRTTKTVGSYSKPSGGIPATDLASAVQTSLGKADTALQTAVTSFNGSTGAVTYTAPVTSVNSQTGAVSLSIPSTASDVGAVAVAQGVEHAGEFVVVGNDGNITTVTMSVWQGGSY